VARKSNTWLWFLGTSSRTTHYCIITVQEQDKRKPDLPTARSRRPGELTGTSEHNRRSAFRLCSPWHCPRRDFVYDRHELHMGTVLSKDLGDFKIVVNKWSLIRCLTVGHISKVGLAFFVPTHRFRFRGGTSLKTDRI